MFQFSLLNTFKYDNYDKRKLKITLEYSILCVMLSQHVSKAGEGQGYKLCALVQYWLGT